MSALEQALAYAARGWRVHPLVGGQKKPRLDGWQHRATTDAREIRTWWATWPDSNVGIVCGQASDLWVLDIDTGDGHARTGGAASFARLIERVEMPDTHTVLTAGGGAHLYFRWPIEGTIKKRAIPEFQGLDSIGEGGYVVAPPSVVGDRCYSHEFGQVGDLAWAPPELLEVVRAEPAAVVRTATAAIHYARPDIEEIRSALGVLPADCSRDEWRDLGMALKTELGEGGFGLWRDWSATAAGRYPGEGELRKQWDSFRGEGITIATLFGRARDAGWRPPELDLSTIRGLGSGRPPSREVVRPEPEIPVLSNCVCEGRSSWARPIAEITAELVNRVGLHGGELFERRQGPVRWLADATDLSAWARRHFFIDWRPVGPTWGELRSDLLAHAEPFAAVLDVPHSPPRPDVFYTASLPPRTWPVGERLRAFLALLNPASPQDGQLLMAMLATSLWGGRPATRPLFLLSSEFGRGSGKTSTVEAISLVFGHGPLMVERLDDERLVSRILSFRGRTILFDNLTRKMQSSAIDSLITAQEINGHKMHVGQTSVANFFTFCATTNTPELSADLADRSVPIKIGQQKHGVDFASEVAALLEGNGRLELLTDTAEWLAGPARGVPAPDRWSPWQRAVLARCEDPEGLQQLILERRGLADRDAEEAEEIYDALWEHAFLMGSPDRQGRRTLTPSECVKALKPLLGDRADNEIKWAALFGKLSKTGALRLVERNKGGKAGRGYTLSPRAGERV